MNVKHRFTKDYKNTALWRCAKQSQFQSPAGSSQRRLTGTTRESHNFGRFISGEGFAYGPDRTNFK